MFVCKYVYVDMHVYVYICMYTPVRALSLFLLYS